MSASAADSGRSTKDICPLRASAFSSSGGGVQTTPVGMVIADRAALPFSSYRYFSNLLSYAKDVEHEEKVFRTAPLRT